MANTAAISQSVNNSATAVSDAEYQALRASELFDVAYYQKRYPDIAKEGTDPLSHYLQQGARSGFDPNPWFETKFYLESNPDVARSSWNPLLHFAKYGWKELRSPSLKYDLVWHWAIDAKGDESIGNPLIAQCRKDAANPRLPIALSNAEANTFAKACHEILASRQLSERQLLTLGKYADGNKLWALAEEVYRTLTIAKPSTLTYQLKLAETIEKQGRTWQLVNVLNDAVALAPDQAELQFRLGDARDRMGRFLEAADAFDKAVALIGSNAEWYYRLGSALEKSGHKAKALNAYTKALGLEKDDQSKKFGIGVFHQARGLWSEAANAYAESIKRDPINAELHYMHAMALDRLYCWKDAERAYRNALTLDVKRPYWHYRLGFVLERQGKLREAAEAFRAAADSDTAHKSYWFYRAAYCLESIGSYEEACETYLCTAKEYYLAKKSKPLATEVTALNQAPAQNQPSHTSRYFNQFEDLVGLADSIVCDYTDAETFFKLGGLMEDRFDWTGAAKYYQLALARKSQFTSSWYYRLGFVLTQSGKWKEACTSFRETRIYKRPFGVDIEQYQKKPAVNTVMEFTEFVETLPISSKTIVYEAYHGASASCNPFAMFQYLLSDPAYSDWTHVWAINDGSCIPEEYRHQRNPNIIWIIRGTSLYRRYLATASHVINNNTLMPWYYRREEQKYLMTWHGTPVKTLGKSILGGFMEHKNATRNFLHATHVISPSRYTSDILMNEYDLKGIATLKLAETGYPRIDLMLNMQQDRKLKLLEALGLNVNQPVVLYAPTWRGTIAGAEVDVSRLISDITEITSKGYQLVFRGHHMMEKALVGTHIPVTVAPQAMDTCELLSIIDVLITDYSSIAFDYFPQRKPIICYAYDKDEYVASRGLYFNLEDLPVRICESVGAVIKALKVACSGKSLASPESYEHAIAKFCNQEDGQATIRAVNFFLQDDSTYCTDAYEDKTQSIAFYAGAFIPNGITTSILNLAEGLAEENKMLSVIVDPDSISHDPLRIEKLGELPAQVKKYARVGIMGSTGEERWIIDMFNRVYSLPNSEMFDIYMKAYKREYIRMLGTARFDVLVQFDGYSRFWGSVFAAGKTASQHNAIYLHNDMPGERDTRFPYLDGIFSLYSNYDRLISVSPSVDEINKGVLAPQFGIEPSKFASCENVLNVDRVISLSKESLDSGIDKWIGRAKVFGTLGRLSPEKDHIKLIRAFEQVLTKYPALKLVIAGDGPLKNELQAYIEKQGLEKNILLAGQLMNPYPLLKRMDLFVFSSKYEGQGIVILEALTLGKPVVSTDVVGPRSILCDGSGLLVEDSEAGLADGMQKHLSKQINSRPFDAYQYRKNSLSQFNSNVSLTTQEKTIAITSLPSQKKSKQKH